MLGFSMQNIIVFEMRLVGDSVEAKGLSVSKKETGYIQGGSGDPWH